MDVLRNTVDEFSAKYRSTHPVAKVQAFTPRELPGTTLMLGSREPSCLSRGTTVAVQACDACIVFSVASVLLQVRFVPRGSLTVSAVMKLLHDALASISAMPACACIFKCNLQLATTLRGAALHLVQPASHRHSLRRNDVSVPLPQLLYVSLTSSFPFNSLLAALACTGGFGVLTCERTGLETALPLTARHMPSHMLCGRHAMLGSDAEANYRKHGWWLIVLFFPCSVLEDADGQRQPAAQCASAAKGAGGVHFRLPIPHAAGFQLPWLIYLG